MFKRAAEWDKYKDKYHCFFCRKRLKPGGLFVARSPEGKFVWGGGKLGRAAVCRKCGRTQPWWVDPKAPIEPTILAP